MSQPLVTAGFHHVTMVARDARRTLAFYRDLLGVALVKQTVNAADEASYHLYFGDDGGAPGTVLTFFEWRNAPRGGWGVGGVHHLALGTATAETQLKWKRRLKDAGVAVSGPYERGYFRSIYFTDPDGQVLEIATRGPGYAIDEPPDALGRTLMRPPDAQLRGTRDDSVVRGVTHDEPVPEVTPDMALEGIHHVTGITGDLTQAGEFYEAALGLRLVKQTLNQDDPTTLHWFWAGYDGREVRKHSAMTLFGWPLGGRRARPGVGQMHHVAFRARNDEELGAWRDHLLSSGIEASAVMDRRYFRSVYFQAPDGQLLELATDGPGFATDEPASALGRSLQLPAELEPRREEIAATLGALG